MKMVLRFISLQRLKERLLKNNLSEAEAFICYFIIITYDLTMLGFSRLIHEFSSLSYFSKIFLFTNFGFTLIYPIIMFLLNGGSKGHQFFIRFFSLGLAVGIKYAAISFLWSLFWSKVGFINEWWDFVFMVVFNTIMLVEMGYHFISLASSPAKSALIGAPSTE